jgi:hypothetical protein
MIAYNLDVEDINLFIKLSLLFMVLGFIWRLKNRRWHRWKLCFWLHDDLVLLVPSPIPSCVLLIEGCELRRLFIILFFPTWAALVTLAFAFRVCWSDFFGLLILLLRNLVLPLVYEILSLPGLASWLLLSFFLDLRRSLWSILRGRLRVRLLRLLFSPGVTIRLLSRLLLLRLLLFWLRNNWFCLTLPPVDKLSLWLSLTTAFLFLLYRGEIFLDLFF